MKNLELFPFPKEGIGDMETSLARSLNQWAEKEVIGKRLELREDYEGLIHPALKKLLVDIELQKVIWPEKYGGAGQNTTDVAHLLALALEQVGRADTGIGFVCSCIFALQSTIALGPDANDRLCQKFGPDFCESGEPFICSLVLPLYGDPCIGTEDNLFGRRFQTVAKKSDGDWTLSGTRVRPINSGVNAKVFGAVCSVDSSTGDEGEPSLILIRSDTDGLARGRTHKETGLAASLNTELNLENVKVPEANLVWTGLDRYKSMLSWLYLCLGATSVGSLFAVYEILREWGDTRVIKGRGQIFKENPLTASLMAEVAKEISICRILLHNLAGTLARPETYGSAGGDYAFITATTAAHHILGASEKATNNAMELMGSAGYAKEWNLERYWRDLKTMQLVIGADAIARMDIARYYYQCQTL